MAPGSAFRSKISSASCPELTAEPIAHTDYDALLQQIASTDVVDFEWSKLRDIIKHKLEKNIVAFLSDDALNRAPPPPRPHSPIELPSSGGLKLAPFPPRKLNPHGVHIPSPVNYMTREQADEMKHYIFTQLHSFDTNPPFTVQRLCELVVNPHQHYKCIGKYLRAVEKSILVTSTWDAFPVPPPSEAHLTVRNPLSSGITPPTAPATPLFSPIPFLHEDARRSKSRSPPPSPMLLPSAGLVSGAPSETPETKALGLVDELDDPSPGHLSDRPKALTSVTTIASGSAAKPLFSTLEDRFVKQTDANQSNEQPSRGK